MAAKASLAEKKVANGGAKPAPERAVAVRTATPNPAWNALALRVQTKSIVGAINDPLEVEADRIADRVMDSGAAPGTADLSAATPPAGSPTVEATIPRGEAGRPLDTAAQSFFENRFQHDFSGVRVYNGPEADGAARAIDARAYTSGSNIVFSRDAYAPGTAVGDRLIAHELSHVVQQQRGSLSIQRQPQPGAGSLLTTDPDVFDDKFGDVRERTWPKDGLFTLTLAEEPWVMVRWTPSPGPLSGFVVKLADAFSEYSVEVSAAFDLHVTVNFRAQEHYAATKLKPPVFKHRYVAHGHTISFNEHLPSAKLVEGEIIQEDQYQGFEIEPTRPVTLSPRQLFWWEADTIHQVDLFAGKHPTYYWAAYQPEDGTRLRARHFTEKEFQELANGYRDDPGFAAGFVRIYENGKAWPRVDALYDIFFANPWDAERGSPGDAPECVVFRHSGSSFGRNALTHEEAIAYWRNLEKLDDAYGIGWISMLAMPERGVFHALMVMGRSGGIHRVGLKYFQLREALFENAASRASGAGVSWNDLFQNSDQMHADYLLIALDREGSTDYRLAGLMDADSGLQEAEGERIYYSVESFARSTAISAIATSREGVAVYLDMEALKTLVREFPFQDAGWRTRTLTYLGFADTVHALYETTLSKREGAQLVAMGEPTAGVSLEAMRNVIAAHVSELDKAISSIRNGDYKPLSDDSEFGQGVRAETYKAFGFDLDPKSYPHAGAASVPFTYATNLSGSALVYAKETARQARAAQRVKWIRLALTIVASVALMIVCAGAGLAAAGLLFSAETTVSLVLFHVTRIVLTAALVTATSPAVSTFIMSGGSAGAQEYKQAYSGIGRQFLENLVMFGVFEGLGAGVRALSILGAGGKQAFAASSAWKTAEFLTRIGTTSAAMFGVSVLDYYLKHDTLPKGEAMDEVLFETGLSIVLIEIGGRLAAPKMEAIAQWAKSARLGDFTSRVGTLRGKIFDLNQKVASYGAHPAGERVLAIELMQHQRELLTEKAKLIADMKKSFRTRPDASVWEGDLNLELAAIQEQLTVLAAMDTFARAEVRTLSTSTEKVPQFSYKRGQEKVLEDYYGKDNVKRVGDHLVVDFQGKQLIFRPATNVEAGILPEGGRNPDALNAWRKTATSRLRKIVERAGKTGADDPALNDVAQRDPMAMDREALRDFEKQLDKAERALDKIEKSSPATPIATDRAGASNESWRQRLVEARDRVRNRAKLLGMEEAPAIKAMNKLRPERSGLKENTLEKHRAAIDEANRVLDEALGKRTQALETASGGKPADVTDLRVKLGARRGDILRRARMYGASDRAYISAVEDLRIGASSRVETLNEAEAALEIAESRLDALSKKALDKIIAERGASMIARIRTTPGLEKLTDAQLGDALRTLGEPARTLSESALRDILLETVTPEGTLRNPSTLRGAKWQPGDPENMPEDGREPDFRKVTERYWRNRAHFELEARTNGIKAQDPKSRDPISVLSNKELADLRDRFTRVPRDPISGKAMELEHSGVQQHVGRALRDLGFSRDEALLLSGANDPRGLMELSPVEHAFFDAFAHAFGRLRADLIGQMWEGTAAADIRQIRPLEPMNDATIRTIVNEAKARGLNFNATRRTKMLRAALQAEIDIRHLDVHLP